MNTLYFRHPWPLALEVVAFIAVAGYAAVLYWRESTLSPGRRVLLGCLRAVLLAGILLLLLEPVKAITRTTTIPANLLVLVDISESMRITDGKSPPRLEIAKGLLDQADLPFFRDPGSRYRLRYFSFAERLEPGPEGAEGVRHWLTSRQATGKSTRLGEALREAVDRYSGQPIAAVVVLTDGASNEGVDPLEAVRNLRVPIFPVGIGQPEPDDVQLPTVLVADTVFPKDRIPVRAQILSSPSLAGRTVDVTLKIDNREVDRKPIKLVGGSQFEQVSFVPETTGGTLRLEVAVSPLAGEVSTANNRLERAVRVLDEKIKVLYVEGKPRWEYRYLRAVLLRDHRLDVRFLLTEGDSDLPSASSQYLGRFPDTEADAYRYDLIILGDVLASTFSVDQLNWLEKLVREKGGSMLLLAGQHAPASYIDTAVAKLLPVRPVVGPRETVDASTHPVVTREGAQSMMMALEPDEEKTQQVWALARPLYDLPPLGGARPGATVLATLSERGAGGKPYPLIAWQRYGSGKSMFVGTDQLWRLRFKRGDEYHARFWGQAIQFLTLSRLLGENKRIRLETQRRTYRAGERITIHANVFDEGFNPSRADAFTVFVETIPPTVEPRAVMLRPVPDTPGVYQGTLTSERPGTFRIQTRPQDWPFSNKADFQVIDSNREQMEPAMQQELLRKLAELSGGKHLGVGDLAALPDLVQDRARTVELPPEETELWNHWLVFLVLVGLAGTEWYLRRSFDVA